MAGKPTYEELESQVRELEEKSPERKQVEGDLKIFKTAVESSINAIGITDLEGKLIYANDSCVKMWDYNSKDEMLGRFLPEFWEGDGVFKTIKELREKGVASGEDVGKRKDGSLFFVQFTASMFNDEAGNPSFMFGSFFDITERKQAEEALRDSEARLKALSDASFEAIFLSEKGVCLDQNQTAEKIFGYTLTEAVGRHGTEWIVPEDREIVKKNMVSGYEKPYEVTALCKDGTTFSCEIQARMIDYQSRSIRVTALRDITERKRANEALRESEERFRMLFTNSTDGIIVVDPETKKFIYANPAICKTLGYTEEELTQMGVVDIHPKNSLEHVVSEFEAQARGDKLLALNIPCLKKDGTIIYVDTSASIVKMGEKHRIMGVFRDITERKRSEEVLKQAHDELEQRVEERTQELELETKRYRTLIEDMPALNCRFKPDGELTFVDTDYCKYFNKTPEELTGQNFFQFIPKEERKKVKKHYQSLNEEKPVVTYEHQAMTPSGEVRWQQWTDRALFDKRDNLIEYQSMGFDITERYLAHQELKDKTKDLEELNAALNILLKKREEDKEDLEEGILSTVRILIEPYLAKLKKSKLTQNQKTSLNILESNLNEIVSPFTRKLSSKYLNLSPSEIQVANLVKQGRTNKEIAEILHVANRTIAFHRENIRKKLALTNQKTNLKTYLMSLD